MGKHSEDHTYIHTNFVMNKPLRKSNLMYALPTDVLESGGVRGCTTHLTFKSHVSTESLYGTNLSLFLLEDVESASLDMTRPSVVRDLKSRKVQKVTTKNTIDNYLYKFYPI